MDTPMYSVAYVQKGYMVSDLIDIWELIRSTRQIAFLTYLQDVWLVSLSLVGFKNSFNNFLLLVKTHLIHFVLEYKIGYALYEFYLFIVLWINFVNLEIWNKHQFGIFISKWWVRMFNTNLKISLLAILQHSHWSCWCHRSLLFLANKNPGTLASHNCTEDLLPYNGVIGVAFSLIMIMLQAKFLFVQVHSLAVSNILSRKI